MEKLENSETELADENNESIQVSEHYVERPMYQRILAWILFGVVVVGIGLYCYWLMAT